MAKRAGWQGWLAIVLAALAASPVQAQVARPWRWLSSAWSPRPRTLADTLSRLERALPAHTWSFGCRPWSAEMVAQVAAWLDEAGRAATILGCWQQSASVVWKDRVDWRRQVVIGAVRFTEISAARAYFGLAVDLQRKQDEKLNTASADGPRLLDARSRAVEWRGIDEGVLTEKKLRLPDVDEPLTFSSLLVRTGDLVVEFSWHGLPADVAWAERTFAALPTGRQP